MIFKKKTHQKGMLSDNTNVWGWQTSNFDKIDNAQILLVLWAITHIDIVSKVSNTIIILFLS